MENKFGKFKRDDRVETQWYIDGRSMHIVGTVVGISHNPVAILGWGYIIELDEPIEDDEFNSKCVVVHELYLRKLNE